MQTVGEGRIRMFMNSIFRAGMANWVDDTLIKGKNFFYPVDIIYFRVTETLFTTRGHPIYVWPEATKLGKFKNQVKTVTKCKWSAKAIPL